MYNGFHNLSQETKTNDLLGTAAIFQVEEPSCREVSRRSAFLRLSADVWRRNDRHQGRVAAGKVVALGVGLAVRTAAKFRSFFK